MVEIWTKASVECWNNNCICSEKCENYHICKSVMQENKKLTEPPVKKIVNNLLEMGVAIPLIYSDLQINLLTITEVQPLYTFLKQERTDFENLATELGLLNSNSAKVCIYNIIDKFEGCYSIDRTKTKIDNFKSWAKQDIERELEKYLKVGVN